MPVRHKLHRHRVPKRNNMDKRVQERQWLVQEIRTAGANQSIRVYFQPSVQLKTKRIIGFEAVPRWVHPSFGEIMPDRFIPIAEVCGLIHELADRLLRQACLRQYSRRRMSSFPLMYSPASLKTRH
jgi:EAL domain-containing protein (putative c-di-GMP-specific phosphodiesterase class I)